MTPEAIKELRRQLRCTARDLARALDTDQSTVLAWERGELFPTKKSVDRMNAWLAAGALPTPTTPGEPKAPTFRRPVSGVSPNLRPNMSPNGTPGVSSAAADAALGVLVRKLVVHADLRAKVLELSANYTDPWDGSLSGPSSLSASFSSAAPSPSEPAVGPSSAGGSSAGGSSSP
jgi:transcriptional regulator with XRE-family HTH domain